MKPVLLTKAQYDCGYIDADAEIPEGCSIQIFTSTSDDEGGQTEWKGPYGVEGSLVESAPLTWAALTIKMDNGGDPSKTPALRRIRWERMGKTAIFPRGVDLPLRFELTRELGTSFRRVLRPTGAVWPETLVFLADTVRIRFSVEPLRITAVSPSGQTVAEPDGRLTTEVRVDDAHTEGNCIEIVCWERDAFDEGAKERSRGQVDAWVGLLALLLGDGFAGDVLSEEYVMADATGERAVVAVPAQLATPPTAPDRSIGAGLVKSADRIGQDRRIELALRWYARGLYSSDHLEAFMSFFFGLEALGSSWFAQLRPRPRRKEWQAARQYFQTAQPRLDTEMIARILGSLARFTLEERFQRYWGDVAGEDIGTRFRKLNVIRNEIAHGSRTEVSDHEMNSCADLLRRALAKELEIQQAESATRRVHLQFDLELGLNPPRLRTRPPALFSETETNA